MVCVVIVLNWGFAAETLLEKGVRQTLLEVWFKLELEVLDLNGYIYVSIYIAKLCGSEALS